MSSSFTAGDSQIDNDIQGQSTVLTAKRGRVKRRRTQSSSEQPEEEIINLEHSLISYADDIGSNVETFCDNILPEIPEGPVTTDDQQLQSQHRPKMPNKNKCVVVLEERILPSNETIKNKNRQMVSTLRYGMYDRPINDTENT